MAETPQIVRDTGSLQTKMERLSIELEKIPFYGRTIDDWEKKFAVQLDMKKLREESMAPQEVKRITIELTNKYNEATVYLRKAKLTFRDFKRSYEARKSIKAEELRQEWIGKNRKPGQLTDPRAPAMEFFEIQAANQLASMLDIVERSDAISQYFWGIMDTLQKAREAISIINIANSHEVKLLLNQG